MKTYIKITLLVTTIIFCSCTEVVDIEVQTAPARLVVEASLDWEKGTAGNNQTIKLSTSTPYFKNNTNAFVAGATVKVTNISNGTEFIFADQNNGLYTTSTFIPIVNNTYTLDIVYNNERYSATEKLMPVTNLTEVFQTKENGDDEEVLEVNLKFTDPEVEENYYLFKFQRQGDLLGTFENTDDEFTNGNEIDWYFEKEEDTETNEKAFVTGDIVDINFYGISEAYSNYIDILISQSEGGDLFASTPVALRGNCVNLDNKDNYANGYFRLTQVVNTSYTFE